MTLDQYLHPTPKEIIKREIDIHKCNLMTAEGAYDYNVKHGQEKWIMEVITYHKFNIARLEETLQMLNQISGEQI